MKLALSKNHPFSLMIEIMCVQVAPKCNITSEPSLQLTPTGFMF